MTKKKYKIETSGITELDELELSTVSSYLALSKDRLGGEGFDYKITEIIAI